jgi:hypothetical protein
MLVAAGAIIKRIQGRPDSHTWAIPYCSLDCDPIADYHTVSRVKGLLK